MPSMTPPITCSTSNDCAENSDSPCRSTEAEHRHQRVIDTPKLLGAEMAGQITETLRIDSPDLLDEHAGCLTVHIDLGAKRRGPRAPRGRRDNHHGSRKKLLGLHHDTKPIAVLFVANTPGQLEPVDVTPEHAVSPSAQPPQAFPHDPHHRLPGQPLPPRAPRYAEADARTRSVQSGSLQSATCRPPPKHARPAVLHRRAGPRSHAPSEQCITQRDTPLFPSIPERRAARPRGRVLATRPRLPRDRSAPPRPADPAPHSTSRRDPAACRSSTDRRTRRSRGRRSHP